jgi:hypothetical protein
VVVEADHQEDKSLAPSSMRQLHPMDSSFPQVCSPIGEKVAPAYPVSHLSSLVFRVECHLVVEHIDVALFALASGGSLDLL